VDDGVVGLGPDLEVQVIPDAGQQNVVRLMTVMYNGNVTGSGTTGNEGPANASKIFFGNQLVRTFTDTTHPTDGQSTFFVGWDGDDSTFDGDIAEVIVYNRVLEACELTALSRYLAEKYGQNFTFAAPGGVNDPTNCNAVWLRADEGISTAGSSVTSWLDQSGNALSFSPDAVSPSATSPAFDANSNNFNPQIDFNTTLTTDFLGAANFSDTSLSAFTLYAVVKTTDSGSGLVHLATGASPDDNRLKVSNPENLNFNVADDSNAVLTVGNVLNNGRPQLLEGTWDAGALNVFQNAAANSGNPYTTDSSAPIPAGGLLGIGQELDNNTDGGFQPAQAFNGGVSEMILYRSILPAAEQLRIESYLALKYGITLDQSAATGSASPERGDYVSSTGALLFDAHDGTAANHYNSFIIGIGRDDLSAFAQRISKSQDPAAIVTLSTDADFTAQNAAHSDSLSDGQYLLLSSDGAAVNQASRVAVNGAQTYEVLLRRWAVKDTGNTPAVNLQFDLSAQSLALNGGNTLALLVDDDGDLSSGVTILKNGDSYNGSTVSISESSGIVSVLGVDFSASGGEQRYFALGLQQEPTVGWAATSSNIGENSASLSVTAELSYPSNFTVTLPFTVNAGSTATQGASQDYTLSSSPLSIPSGEATADVTISLHDDQLLENSETVILELGTPTNARLSGTLTHTATILDDDSAGDDDNDGILNADECPGLTNCPDTDGDGIIDLLDPESDGDGIPDSTECPGGAPCADSDNNGIPDVLQAAGEVIDSPVFMIWNGFYEQTNIAALANKSGSQIQVEATLLDLNGNTLSVENLTLAPKSEFDLIVNDMQGYSADSYGLLRLSFDKPLSFDGHSAHYRFSGAGQEDIDFAILQPVQNALRGNSSVFFNTLQPSLRAADEDNAVPNWAQIGNLESTAKDFSIVKYNARGELLSTERLEIPPLGRRDIAAGHEFAERQVGMVEIIPDDQQGKYIAQLYHYGLDAPLGVAPQAIRFALGETFRKGDQQVQYVTVSSGAGALNWLAVGNASDSEGQVRLQIIANDGTIGLDETLTLGARAQEHILASALLPAGESGVAILTPLTATAFISNSRSYYFGPDASVTEAGLEIGRSVLGSKPISLFNSYLDQLNWLRLFNVSGSSVDITVEARNADGSSLGSAAFTLPARQGLDVELKQNLNFNIPAGSYGQVRISQNAASAIVAEDLRFALTPQGQVKLAKPVVGR
jgi:hypothetical protein